MDRLIESVATLGSDRLYELPGEGEWSAMQTLAHVAEFVPFWAARALEFANGRLGDRPFDRTPDEWSSRSAAVAQHGSDALTTMLARLQSSRDEAVATLRAIPDAAWTRLATDDNGEQHELAAWIARRLLGHVESHVRQAVVAAGGS